MDTPPGKVLGPPPIRMNVGFGVRDFRERSVWRKRGVGDVRDLENERHWCVREVWKIDILKGQSALQGD